MFLMFGSGKASSPRFVRFGKCQSAGRHCDLSPVNCGEMQPGIFPRGHGAVPRFIVGVVIDGAVHAAYALSVEITTSSPSKLMHSGSAGSVATCIT